METTQQMKKYRRMIAFFCFTTLVSTGLLTMSIAGSPFAPGKTIPISAETATQYATSYLNTATAVNDVIKGVVIEAGQLESMNLIDRQYPDAVSFRVYFGKDNAGADVAMVVGVKADGTDMALPIYCSDRTGSNICPPICDAAGGIMPDE